MSGAAPSALSLGQAFRYGALGLPLAFVALPLYVMLPAYYAERWGVPLASLGLLLLAARLFDAFIDPWIGRRADGWFRHAGWRLNLSMGGLAVLLAVSFGLLFFPRVQGHAALLAWCGACLLVTYTAYSALSVIHQAWGARLGGDAVQRARVVSWREGLSLVGVLLASVLPSAAGMAWSATVFAVMLAGGLAMLMLAPRVQGQQVPASGGSARPEPVDARPLSNPAFRQLMGVYLCNGIASAVPATLVLFFIRDRLQLPQDEALFLGAYFAAAALSMPLWLRVIRSLGLTRSWLLGMVMAMASFAWALGLGAGDRWGFLLVCLSSGVALGADLAVPGALLAGVIQRAGQSQSAEGAYFGWWNFATKLNLALAAGLALPLLQLLGYVPGQQQAEALQALAWVYCALPCALKLCATVLLYRLSLRQELL